MLECSVVFFIAPHAYSGIHAVMPSNGVIITVSASVPRSLQADGLWRDAMETAAQSGRHELVEELLRGFIDKGELSNR